MAVFLSPVGGAAVQFFDNSGQVLTGGLLYTYLAGTTTPAATYTSNTGTQFHTNPIILDASGRIPNGGEVWLAENIQYKFVLKDSNSVLIGTWDNIIGINSNFLNYNVQEETQTATQGQTVFTLATISYTPGTNTLSVYVNGSKQIPVINYAETDATTITFLTGLNVGDIVDFTTAISLSSGVTSADLVTYNEGQAGAVDRTVEAKLQETVSVLDFGADPTGITDSTVAINAAIASFGVYGGRVYFPVGTYLTTGITLSKLDMVFYGEGQFNTVIKGSNAGAAVISLATGSAFSHWSDLTIDGNDIKDAAIITTGDTSEHTFTNVRFCGGALNTVCWGTTAGNPDVADSSFFSCVIQSNNATQGQLKIRGNNTSGNHFFGGRISTGNSVSGNAVDIDDGAEVSFFGTNLLALPTDYAIKAASGTIKVYGGHCESGGFMETRATDIRNDSYTQPHAIYDTSMAVGFGSGLPAINHLANRTMIVQGGYCGDSNIVVGAGAKMIASGVSMLGAIFDVNATGTLYAANSGAKSTLAGQAGVINADVLNIRTSSSASVNGRSKDVGNTTPQPLIGVNQDTGQVQLGGGSYLENSSIPIQIANIKAADIAAGNAILNGTLLVDNTNHRLVFYSNGARYYIAGTSF